MNGTFEPPSSEDRLLLSRCFGMCGEVRLQEMSGGLSEARVFRVETTSGNSVGSWAQPCFAKIDRVDKIIQEAEKYGEAAPFIPFSLRPNLVRVLLGAQRGVLVGNLVDRAEPLWTVVRRGGADAVINNLFSVTLGGWRGIALRSKEARGSVFTALEACRIVRKDDLSGSPITAAARDRGALSVDRIWAVLGGLNQTFYRGPIHGDLHAENVLVRGNDAVLIDLALVREGPIIADVALLETWLAFAVHPDDKPDVYEAQAWNLTVDRLYSPRAFRRPPPPSDATMELGWLWDAVRQLRILACSTQSCESEYQVAVVGAMLRMCLFNPKNNAEKFRRTKAYLLASELVRDLAEGVNRYAA